MEKGGWAQPAAPRELRNLGRSALLLGTPSAQGRRLLVLPTAALLVPSGVCFERRVGLRLSLRNSFYTREALWPEMLNPEF